MKTNIDRLKRLIVIRRKIWLEDKTPYNQGVLKGMKIALRVVDAED